MAFIVNLTHIMELLFILTSGNHKKLTRHTIKLAYTTYFDSATNRQVHADIETYRDFKEWDAALEMIESLIKPERSSGSTDCYTKVGELVQDIPKLNLDQEEEWELFPH